MIDFKKEKLLKAKRITGFTLTHTELLIGEYENIYAILYSFISGNEEIIIKDDLYLELVVDEIFVKKTFEDVNEWKKSQDEVSLIGKQIINILIEDIPKCVSCNGMIYPGECIVKIYDWLDEKQGILDKASHIGKAHECCIEYGSLERR